MPASSATGGRSERLPRWGEARSAIRFETATVPAAHMRSLFVAAAAAIYVAVFVVFLFFEHPGLGIGHFYYFAVALVALALGPVWGAAGGVLGTALYALGVLLNQELPTSEIVTSSMPIRLITYVAIGT